MVLDNVIKLINDTPDYSWISGVVTIIATMITVYCTNRVTVKQIKSEIDNYKQTQFIDINKKILEYATQLIRANDIKSKEEQTELMRNLILSVIAHGSKESVSILAAFQQYNYCLNDTNIPKDNDHAEWKFRTLIYPSLLIAQIKYETTGHIISVMDILRINITDLNELGLLDEIKNQNNKIIDELGLNKKFKI